MKWMVLKAFTVLWLVGMYLAMMFTFAMAYQSPEKAVKVDINQANEADLEFVMLSLGLFVTLVGAAFIMRDIRSDFFNRALRNLERGSA